MKQLIIHIIDLDTQKTWEVYSVVSAYLVLLQNSITNAKVLSNDSNFNLNLNVTLMIGCRLCANNALRQKT